MRLILLAADTPFWLQVVIAAIAVESLYLAMRAHWRNGGF